MARKKTKCSLHSLQDAMKLIGIVLKAYQVTNAMIIIANDDDYQSKVFGNEKDVAKNLKNAIDMIASFVDSKK